jgi:hypothetical protein
MEAHHYTAALRGAKIDLELLARCFNTDDCRVEQTTQREVANGPYYQLSSTRLELTTVYERQLATDGGVTTPIEVDVTWDKARENAERLLSVMHGAARLVRSEYKPVAIGAMIKFSMDGRCIGSESRTAFGDDWRSYTLPSERTGLAGLTRLWAEKGLEDDAVFRALAIYGAQPLSWSMLYMVYEIVREDAQISQFITKSRENDFTKAANNARALRQGPRHAFTSTLPEESLIFVEEGHTVIRDLLNGWLATKVGSFMQY